MNRPSRTLETTPLSANGKRLDFLAVGPQRTGTTWIYDYLVEHPQVCVSTEVKESFFFNREYRRGTDWYWSLFTPNAEHRVLGEVAPTYFHSPVAASRIRELRPKCTILVSLRDPVERTVSLYRHLQRLGEIAPDRSIGDALGDGGALLDSSRYARHLRRWIETFGAERVHLLRFEDLESRPEAFAGEICDALGVDSFALGRDPHRVVNPSVEPRSHRLQRVATGLNRSARRLGLHSFVRRVKATGLNRLLLRPTVREPLAAEDLRRVLDAVAPEAEALATDFGVDISAWTSAWAEAGAAR